METKSLPPHSAYHHSQWLFCASSPWTFGFYGFRDVIFQRENIFNSLPQDSHKDLSHGYYLVASGSCAASRQDKEPPSRLLGRRLGCCHTVSEGKRAFRVHSSTSFPSFDCQQISTTGLVWECHCLRPLRDEGLIIHTFRQT